MGFGITYPGVELPRSVPKLIYKLNQECGVPSDRLEWHGHNDFHKVLVNGGSAWLYGCDAVNGTLFGAGERTGNPPLEGAIIEYISLKGDLNGIVKAKNLSHKVMKNIKRVLEAAGSNFDKIIKVLLNI